MRKKVKSLKNSAKNSHPKKLEEEKEKLENRFLRSKGKRNYRLLQVAMDEFKVFKKN